MSISRGNWSTLSRLAQQWAEDDEEEQIRERRRRNRDLSTTNRVVEISSETGSSQPASTAQKEDKRKTLNKAQIGFQENQKEETESPEQQNDKNKITYNNVKESKVSTAKTQEVEQLKGAKQDTQRVSAKKDEKQSYARTHNYTFQQKDKTFSQVEPITKEHDVEQPKSAIQETQRVTDNKEETQKHRNVLNYTQEQLEDKKPSNQKENHFSENEQCQEPKEATGTLQNLQNDGGLDQNSDICEKNGVMKTQLQETSPQNEKESKQVQDQPKQRKNSSSTITVSLTPSQLQHEANTSSSDGNQSKFKTKVFVSSVKIPRRSDSGIKSPPPVPEVIEEESFTKAVKSDVFIPAVSSTSQDSKHDSSPQPTSSSFVRLGRLTSSVRTKSQSEDKNDGGFTRSSHLRFSLRSRKIEDRMEKYTTAIQKSASVRMPASYSRAGTGSSDGIANKRIIFEKEEENPNANVSRKDLALPGSVTSRINQWSNKEQQSPSTVTGTKGIRTGDVATKRMLWQQRSQSSNDTKL